MRREHSALIVIGDVHGDATRLEKALDTVRIKQADVVLVGDYVNRGRDSRQVLDLLVSAKAKMGSQLTLLRGNHEVALLAFLDGGPLEDFAAHGGLATVRSYFQDVPDHAVETFRDSFPDGHRRLLESTEGCFEDDSVLISHAGFDPQIPNGRQPAALYGRGTRDLFNFDGDWPRPLTVFGHFVQRSQSPYVSEHLICLDTGCGTLPGAPLTAVCLPERTFMQF